MALLFDPLPVDLASALDRDARRLGSFARVRFVAEVDSTNDVAMALALEGADEGSSVLADAQRAGRGRRGRQWFSPPGAGIYLSVVLRPRGPAERVPLVTLAAGAAAAGAVQDATGLVVELKWPNDIVIGRPWRKLGGILTEGTGVGDRIETAVVGIGLNLASTSYPPDLADRATSIETELGRPADRATLVVSLLRRLRTAFERLHGDDHDAITHEWRTFAGAALGGIPVRWHDQTGARQGRARDLDRDGALLVETGGTLERVVGGDVHWEGLSRE